ncbi:MAG: hypothetical protein JXB47_04035, partial [Anaerolineae bacterium]|nr:hypothetical protein [Anaerolineae bacterium]
MYRRLALILALSIVSLGSGFVRAQEDIPICEKVVFTQAGVSYQDEAPVELAFAWTAHERAASYLLEVLPAGGDAPYAYEVHGTDQAIPIASLFGPDPRLNAGEFAYRVTARDLAGSPICRSGYGFLALDDAALDSLLGARCTRIVVVLAGSPYTGPRDLDVEGDNFEFEEDTFDLGAACGLEIHGNANANFIYAGPGDDIIYGYEGADDLDGGEGSDLIFGDAGDDILYGGDDAGSDTLYGGAGNDNLDGGAGDDALDGDAGNDILYGGDDAGSDTIYGGDGNDDIDGGDGDDTIYGEAGDDILYGGDDAGRDALYGGEGSDEIDGGGGDDYIDGGPGDDPWLAGGDGDDTIYGGDGADELDGGFGNDILDGGPGSDTWIFGGEGADTIYGGEGADELDGGPGDDILYGGEGDDPWIFGGEGNDTLDGGPGCDYLDGGPGDNTLSNACDEEETEAGGGEATMSDDAMAEIARQWGRCVGGAAFESVELATADDVVTGINFRWTPYPEARVYSLRIFPATGGPVREYQVKTLSQSVPVADLPAAPAGELGDLQELAPDPDAYAYYLVAMTSAHQAICQTGYGYLTLDPALGIKPDPACNRLVVVMADSPYTGPRDLDLPDSADYGADDIELGPMCGVVIHANNGDNEISGTAGDDIIYGYAGNDPWISGEAGDDIIFGGPGDDEADGGPGDDYLFGGPGNDLWLSGGEGNDFIYGQEGGDEADGGPGDDYIDGGPGDDT